ncbi:DNA (cytosine-5-)-methyltransferase [Caldalkalibacillus thermarum TA2.A1]|uniref:Cytosine-specific methyltransferase n=1 Tax=Caldalkalibacillus thermarum (strain TA2.A1) TaxID=986075 RepID=A0A8X8ICZ2_CALTT|nr:DNA (cytosine-5-)-methyltransferase [Caldalkalibacillus thermarum]QZT35225.1 DNA (cytosine-5-)-methyltransferase [Caldalkalibacillus thermarum TA2.A1]
MTVGSLFTGIGGIDLAAEWAGMKIIWQCEIDPFCQKVLRKHWPEVKLYDDIRKINKSNTVCPDVIVGGFPCQPYSIAGKRRGKEDDRDLWPEMFRVVKELRPTWVVGENVAGFINLGLDRTISDLESEGYETQTFIIPACAVNAPHRRDRTFIVAHSGRQLRKRGVQRGTDEMEVRKGNAYKSQRSSEVCRYFITNSKRKRLQRSQWIQKSIQFTHDTEKIGRQWESEPDVGRVANGVPNRVDRLRALGNAVVPQQIYPIMKAISLIEEQLAGELNV